MSGGRGQDVGRPTEALGVLRGESRGAAPLTSGRQPKVNSVTWSWLRGTPERPVDGPTRPPVPAGLPGLVLVSREMGLAGGHSLPPRGLWGSCSRLNDLLFPPTSKYLLYFEQLLRYFDKTYFFLFHSLSKLQVLYYYLINLLPKGSAYNFLKLISLPKVILSVGMQTALLV